MVKVMVVLVSLLSFFGCRSEDRIVAFSLSKSDGRGNGYRYEVRETEDGKVHFLFNKGFPSEKEYYSDDHSVFDTLDQIVRKYHMKRYRSNYRPWGNFKDGYSWSLSVDYASGKEISTGGYMASPMNWGKAREELLECLDYWKGLPVDAPVNDTITYFSLSEGGGMNRFSGFNYTIEKTKDGKVHFLFDKGLPGEKEFTLDDHSVFDSLQNIVEKYKMYEYSGHYQPEFDITDGSSWDLYVKYTSKKNISAGGYMAGPEGYWAAFREIIECLDHWKEMPVATNDVISFLYVYGKESYSIERKDDHAVLTYDNEETGAHRELERELDLMEDLRITFNIGGLKMNQTRGKTDSEGTPWFYDITYRNGEHYRYESCDREFRCGYTEQLQGFISNWMNETDERRPFYYHY